MIKIIPAINPNIQSSKTTIKIANINGIMIMPIKKSNKGLLLLRLYTVATQNQ